MLKVEITEQAVRLRRRRDGQGEYRVQEAYLHKGGKYPEPFDLPLGKDEHGRDNPPLAPGVYEVDEARAFTVFARRLEFWPVLRPVRAAQSRVA